ncbi:MAG: hypothetical protein KKA07_10400 [Bacteroidetes bacterium]|nr:hypothetical protein [Bacteroidota bacterium]
MKNYYKEIVLGGVLLFVFSGLIFWFIFTKPQSFLPVGIAILTLLIGIATFIKQTINKKRDIETGAPVEDEFIKLAKVYAGNQAFRYSMYLWLLIFVFNSSLTKNETMLGIGILGSALIYGISLWYFKTTGEFNE